MHYEQTLSIYSPRSVRAIFLRCLERALDAPSTRRCMASQELFALLDESFVLVDHLRFITRSRTALDRRGVSRTAAQFKRELSEHKLAASCRARQVTARASKATGLAERLAERLAAYRELEARFAELLRLEGEATQVCLSAEGELEAAYTDLADENRRVRAVAAAARERAEHTIEQAAATHEATRCVPRLVDSNPAAVPTAGRVSPRGSGAARLVTAHACARVSAQARGREPEAARRGPAAALPGPRPAARAAATRGVRGRRCAIAYIATSRTRDALRTRRLP